ncbi:MAG: serine hydrolase [Pseudomonadota bacterium]
MKTWLKRIGIGLAFLTVATSAAAFWKWDEITRLRAVNTLFAPERIVGNFTSMGDLFHSTPLTNGPGRALPDGASMTLPPGTERWIADRTITGLVVLRDGAVVHESYHQGTTPEDQRISWSVGKSVLSLLTGILIDEGALTLTDPVTQHAPLLIGGAYDGATLEDVLQMESGVLFDEDYAAFDSDINRMGRVLALGGTLDGFTADLDDNWAMPGEAMRYVSMDTHVIGMVLRGVTGRSIPDLMAEKLAGPMGLGPAHYLTDETGVAFVLGGLNMATRDFAKVGQLVLDGGRVGDRQIVPEAWIEASTVPSATTAPDRMRYGYQWWMPVDMRPGEVMAQGVYGQFVYVDRSRNVVVAMNAADRGFNSATIRNGNVAMFREIAASTDP